MTCKGRRFRTSSERDSAEAGPIDIAINIDDVATVAYNYLNYSILIVLQDEFIEDDLKYDWWSKYYASVGESGRAQEGYMEENHDTFVVYAYKL